MTTKTNTTKKNPTKERKYLLIISFLYILLLAYTVVVISCLAIFSMLKKNPHIIHPISLPVLEITLAVAILNIICLWAMINWQKWGFWGYCLLTTANIPLAISLGMPWQQASLSLLGLLVLFGMYQVGGNKKAWYKLS
jgi:hypothetical protein